MFKKLQQQLAAKREAGKAGPLTGKQLSVGSRVVKVDRLLGEGEWEGAGAGDSAARRRRRCRCQQTSCLPCRACLLATNAPCPAIHSVLRRLRHHLPLHRCRERRDVCPQTLHPDVRIARGSFECPALACLAAAMPVPWPRSRRHLTSCATPHDTLPAGATQRRSAMQPRRWA